MSRIRTLLFLIFPAFILVTDVAALFLLQDRPSYPYLVLQADNGVQLTILQQASKSSAICESARASFENAITLGCPNCRVKISTCTTHLDANQVSLLSAVPLKTYSASIPNGVVQFDASDAALAKSVCEESAQSRSGSPTNVVCFAPGLQRQATVSAIQDSEPSLRVVPLAWLAISGLFLLAWVYAIRLDSKGSATATNFLISLPRRHKQLFVAFADLATVELTLWLSFVLKSETIYVPYGDALWLFLSAGLLSLPTFAFFGLYQSVIRYLALRAMLQIAKGVAAYLLLLILTSHYLLPTDTPLSIFAIHASLLLVLVGTTRGLARALLTQAQSGAEGSTIRKSVVIYGAGSAGIQLANALNHSKELHPVAFLDDDLRLSGRRLGELDVYAPSRLGELIDRFSVTQVLLAIPSTSRQRRREIIDNLESLPVKVSTLPALSDLAEGKIKVDDLQEVDIDDLLGRDPVMPDARLLNAKINGKSVMVTGAGGSIGSELCRQIVALGPRSLVLYEQSEYGLYRVEQEVLEILGKWPSVSVKVYPIIGSVADQARMERIISGFSVETIYHAAAYKHVPLVEHNPCEGILNNVIGTYHAVLAAMSQKVETFVLVSTDKAVRPTNTMGATKRFAEMILQAFAAEQQRETSIKMSVVRFGNVLGSSGSVVPLFREQIRRGGPVTVTDPRIIRYFMTISEAAQLVLQAGAMGENGDIFVLDMGDPVKILDLAHRMIRLSGLQLKSKDNPAGDIEVVFTGLRPGEKLYEELLTGDNPAKTVHPRIMRASEKMLPLDTLRTYLGRIESAASNGDSSEARNLLLEIVEDFRPQCGNEDLSFQVKD